jgi:hypothetical protein
MIDSVRFFLQVNDPRLLDLGPILADRHAGGAV